MTRRGKDERRLAEIIKKLLKKKPLSQKNADHPLGGNWKNRRECHIEPDWLLIYCVRENELILERTGSHSDLYK